MICDNFEEGGCRYFGQLRGTGEDYPSGMNESNGNCDLVDNGIVDADDWIEAEPEDCDMLDLEENN